MEKKYVILARYEHWTEKGKEWTKWFTYRSQPMDEKTGNESIKRIRNDFGFIEQKTKLKHEYALEDYDKYLKEQAKDLERIKEINNKQAEYYKSEEYKELQKKKRQAAKERKERQKQYAIEHNL